MGQRGEPANFDEIPSETAGEPQDGADEWQRQALIDEALKKSALIWLTRDPPRREQAFWHAWVDGLAYLLTGPGEQPDPGLQEGERLRLVVRSKDTVQRLVVVDATAHRLQPDDDDWEAATAALAAGRLNLAHAEQAPARWAGDAATAIYRLTLGKQLVEGPGHYADTAHRATPSPTPATTATRRPWVLHKRGGSGRRLS
ncbi:MAG: hypothetical protein H0U36_06425 [Nocardioidaceae bacterium]|nr:hypothetical protein [Nocardioidaceae bacterium]